MVPVVGERPKGTEPVSSWAAPWPWDARLCGTRGLLGRDLSSFLL